MGSRGCSRTWFWPGKVLAKSRGILMRPRIVSRRQRSVPAALAAHATVGCIDSQLHRSATEDCMACPDLEDETNDKLARSDAGFTLKDSMATSNWKTMRSTVFGPSRRLNGDSVSQTSSISSTGLLTVFGYFSTGVLHIGRELLIHPFSRKPLAGVGGKLPSRGNRGLVRYWSGS